VTFFLNSDCVFEKCQMLENLKRLLQHKVTVVLIVIYLWTCTFYSSDEYPIGIVSPLRPIRLSNAHRPIPK